MTIAYIRKTYALPVKVGMEVLIRAGAGTWFDGMRGKVLRANGQYVVVAGSTWRGNFHPGDIVIPPPSPPVTVATQGSQPWASLESSPSLACPAKRRWTP